MKRVSHVLIGRGCFARESGRNVEGEVECSHEVRPRVVDNQRGSQMALNAKEKGTRRGATSSFFYGRKGSDKRVIDREEVNEQRGGYGNREVRKKRLPGGGRGIFTGRYELRRLERLSESMWKCQYRGRSQ